MSARAKTGRDWRAETTRRFRAGRSLRGAKGTQKQTSKSSDEKHCFWAPWARLCSSPRDQILPNKEGGQAAPAQALTAGVWGNDGGSRWEAG